MSEKEKNNQQKKKKGKLVTGIVIGGALGSILGMAFAPKPGKETRKILKQKSSSTAGSFFRGARALLKGKKKDKN